MTDVLLVLVLAAAFGAAVVAIRASAVATTAALRDMLTASRERVAQLEGVVDGVRAATQAELREQQAAWNRIYTDTREAHAREVNRVYALLEAKSASDAAAAGAIADQAASYADSSPNGQQQAPDPWAENPYGAPAGYGSPDQPAGA